MNFRPSSLIASHPPGQGGGIGGGTSGQPSAGRLGASPVILRIEQHLAEFV